MTIIEKEEEGVSLAGERGGVTKGSLACFILWGGGRGDIYYQFSLFV